MGGCDRSHSRRVWNSHSDSSYAPPTWTSRLLPAQPHPSGSKTSPEPTQTTHCLLNRHPAESISTGARVSTEYERVLRAYTRPSYALSPHSSAFLTKAANLTAPTPPNTLPNEMAHPHRAGRRKTRTRVRPAAESSASAQLFAGPGTPRQAGSLSLGRGRQRSVRTLGNHRPLRVGCPHALTSDP